MTNETQEPMQSHVETKPAPIGARLKTAREAMGLDSKDAAAQLRLNESIILMMEKDQLPDNLPMTFVRGYIRAYGKLLQIPDHEIKQAIEPIKPNLAVQEPTPQTLKPMTPVTSGNYYMQFFTYLIVLTIVGLVGTWWYSHSSNNTTTIAIDTQAIPTTDVQPTLSTSDPKNNAINQVLAPTIGALASPDSIEMNSSLPPQVPQSPGIPFSNRLINGSDATHTRANVPPQAGASVTTLAQSAPQLVEQQAAQPQPVQAQQQTAQPQINSPRLQGNNNQSDDESQRNAD